MNHICRHVWSRVHNALIAVAEIAGSVSPKSGPRHAGVRVSKCSDGSQRANLARALALLLAGVPPVALALPSGGHVQHGQATIHVQGHTLNVDQQTKKAIVNWQKFGIKANQTVDFDQPGLASIALNRVTGGNPSQIMGHLDANGQLFLVNPAGITFGQGARVDVGGIVASTLNISNQNFLNGNYQFQGTSSAGVTNQGAIKTSQGGSVAFIGRTVTNDGTIRTPGGNIALEAGGRVDLTLAKNHLLHFAVKQAALKAAARNGGLIKANKGGTVVLSAHAKNAALQTVVNNSGIVRAHSVGHQQGHIALLGGRSGTTRVAGTLDASAPKGGNGGTIETSGDHVQVANDATITTQAAHGRNGQWTIDPSNFTIASSGGDITGAQLSSDLSSNNVTIKTSSSGNSKTVGTHKTSVTPASGDGSKGDINVDAPVSWHSSHTLTLSAYRDINVNAAMNVNSSNAGLAFDYGQGSSGGTINGTPATDNVNAPVNLVSGVNFTTQRGSSGSTRSYTIINRLGSSGTNSSKTLQGMKNNLSKNYVLGSDINAQPTGTNSTAWGTNGFAPVGNNYANTFQGTFDDLGHTISGLTINRPKSSNVSLFGIASNSTIRNVGLVGGSVTGSNDVGGLAGSNSGTITNVYATGKVNGNNNVGGLAGLNLGGTIINAYATGTVNATGKYSSYIGGLVGDNSNGTISDAYATGMVKGTNSTNAVGGLVGGTSGTLRNAYATGTVKGTGRNVGGLVGYNSHSSTIQNGYWDTTTDNVKGRQGVGNSTKSNVQGKTTAKLASNLPPGFNSSTWGNAGGQTTPYLKANSSFDSVSGSVILGSTNGGGKNTNATPAHYNVILGVQQLQHINTTGLGQNYVLGRDINASATSRWNGGKGFAPLGNNNTKFTGTFDGLGHTVSGLTIKRGSTYYVGLFGITGNSNIRSTIRNVGLVGDSVTGGTNVGGLVGSNSNGTIRNAYATGKVSGSYYVGGLVGSAYYNSTIRNVYATGTVSGTKHVGGLVGGNGGTISNVYATGTVTGNNAVGGLVGGNGSNSISNAYATGAVTGSGKGVGGLVGSNDHGIIRNDYATSSVSGSGTNVGGLVGSNNAYSKISNAYATGTVSGSGAYDVGGLVGQNDNHSTISNAYATGTVSGGGTVGGLVGFNGSNKFYISSKGTISNAYATGTVSGSSNVGGLVGYNSGTISNTYWDSNTAGSNVKNGVGNQPNNSNVKALTAAHMEQQSSFSGFDFTKKPVWRIYNNDTKPLLETFLTPLTISGGPTTKTYGPTVAQILADYTFSKSSAPTSGHLKARIGKATLSNGQRINVGNNYTPDFYSDQQGYDITNKVSSSLTINPRPLTASINGTPTKTYDGSNSATIASGDVSLSGFVGNQGASASKNQLNGTYSQSGAGSNITISAPIRANDFSFKGNTSLKNYSLPGSASGPGKIARKTLKVSNVSATDKTYTATRRTIST